MLALAVFVLATLKTMLLDPQAGDPSLCCNPMVQRKYIDTSIAAAATNVLNYPAAHVETTIFSLC